MSDSQPKESGTDEEDVQGYYARGEDTMRIIGANAATADASRRRTGSSQRQHQLRWQQPQQQQVHSDFRPEQAAAPQQHTFIRERLAFSHVESSFSAAASPPVWLPQQHHQRKQQMGLGGLPVRPPAISSPREEEVDEERRQLLFGLLTAPFPSTTTSTRMMVNPFAASLQQQQQQQQGINDTDFLRKLETTIAPPQVAPYFDQSLGPLQTSDQQERVQPPSQGQQPAASLLWRQEQDDTHLSPNIVAKTSSSSSSSRLWPSSNSSSYPTTTREARQSDPQSETANKRRKQVSLEEPGGQDSSQAAYGISAYDPRPFGDEEELQARNRALLNPWSFLVPHSVVPDPPARMFIAKDRTQVAPPGIAIPIPKSITDFSSEYISILTPTSDVGANSRKAVSVRSTTNSNQEYSSKSGKDDDWCAAEVANDESGNPAASATSASHRKGHTTRRRTTKASFVLLDSQQDTKKAATSGKDDEQEEEQSDDGEKSQDSTSTSTGEHQQGGRSTSSSSSGAAGRQQNEQWMVRYSELLEFRAKNGHSNVPFGYKDHRFLAQWIKRQRYQFKCKMKGRKSHLTTERQELLERIGFQWDYHVAAWQEKFALLALFRREHGHCLVPTREKRLFAWCKRQRRQYRFWFDGKSSALTEDRIQRLSDLGFPWYGAPAPSTTGQEDRAEADDMSSSSGVEGGNKGLVAALPSLRAGATSRNSAAGQSRRRACTK